MSRPKVYHVTDLHRGGPAEKLEVTATAEGQYTVTVGGEVVHLDAVVLPHGAVSMIIEGHSYSVEFEDVKDEVHVLVRGQLSRFDVVDERRLMQRAADAAAHQGRNIISAPMPGKVVRVEVKVGDVVERGQGVVVVEAMKMENELKSPARGTVTQVLAVEGSAVDSGAPLVIVE